MSKGIQAIVKDLRSWYYYKFTTSKKVTGKQNKIFCNGADLIDCEINIVGEGNTLIIGKGSKLSNTKINIIGSNNVIDLGYDVQIKEGCQLNAEDRRSKITIGNHTTAVGALFLANEGAHLDIGKDCMIATGVKIRNSDGHSIFDDATSKRINPANNIFIGDHVWLCTDVGVMKGSRICSGSVIGTKSLVNGHIATKTIAIGNPARSVREKITWSRSREKVQQIFTIKKDLGMAQPPKAFISMVKIKNANSF